MHEGKPALVREQIAALRAAENVKAFGAFGQDSSRRMNVSIYLCTYAPLVNCRGYISGRAFTSTYAFRASSAPFAEFRRDPPVRKLVVDDRTERNPTPYRHRGDRSQEPENRRFPGSC